MLIGLFLRHFKTYDTIHFIPVSRKDNFTAFIGENGIGKSSILQALDTYFNNFTWILNHKAKRAGKTELDKIPFIMPIFAIHKNSNPTFETIDACFRADSFKKYNDFHSLISNHYSSDNYYIIGHAKYPYKDFENVISPILPETFSKICEEKGYNQENCITEISKYYNDNYEYIYLPVEINEADFTKLANKDMQKLINCDLNNKVNQIIGAKDLTKKINSNLEDYLNEIHENLTQYKYENLNKHGYLTEKKLVETIIKVFFENKQLVFYTNDDNKARTPISDLSAGEKRKAIIDISLTLLSRIEDRKKNFIFAIDEPEASLSSKNAFQQFLKIRELTEYSQVLISTHWYGFIPSIDCGLVNALCYNDTKKLKIDSVNLLDFQKETKDLSKGSSKTNKLPNDKNLKSYNDLVQSIFATIADNPSYNWIICEGITDNIYLESHLGNDFIKKNNLILLPMAGWKFVKKILDYLRFIVEQELENFSIKGKVLALIDTDRQFHFFNNSEMSNNIKQNILFKRLVLDTNKNEVSLIDVYQKESLTFPTTVENILSPNVFFECLKELVKKYSFDLTFSIQTKDNIPNNSYSANYLKLYDTEKAEIENFFTINNGDIKIEFAKLYAEKIKNDTNLLDIPWVKEIKNIFQENNK